MPALPEVGSIVDLSKCFKNIKLRLTLGLDAGKMHSTAVKCRTSSDVLFRTEVLHHGHFYCSPSSEPSSWGKVACVGKYKQTHQEIT